MARPVLGTSNRQRRAAGASITRLDRDRPLVEAAKRDPSQFDALYRRYLAQVYSFAFYELGDHHEAEDATERAFLAALAGLDRFEERAEATDGADASTFRIWLFRIARNAVANQRRHRRRHPADPRDEATTAGQAIERLPADRRRAIILRFVDDMSTSEIASVLGRSEGAVRVLLHRALRAVGRELGAGTSGTGRSGARAARRR
jgi:RNA polymerase sigma-70 factor, ECF subfamily